MMQNIRQHFVSYLRNESATATLEFVLVYPFFLFLFLWSVEIGIWMLRATALERGLDFAVREIRLSPANNRPSEADSKATICEYAGYFENCVSNLKLELRETDPRAFTGLDANVDCHDRKKEVKPAQHFVHGQAHSLMLVRACMIVDPLFPQLALGGTMVNQSDGTMGIYAISTFVQEP
jgi:hypothetical protein